MKRQLFGPMLLAAILFVLTINYMGFLTETLVKLIWLKPGVAQAIGASQTPVAFQGIILQQKAFESGDILPLYGSSEFSAVSDFHPSKIFDGKPSGFVPFLIGRGGSQDLIHAVNIAALGNVTENKKLALVLSAQWFTGEGLTEAYFSQNFSALQAYGMLFNPKLSQATKQKLAARLLHFKAVWQDYPVLAKLLYHYGQPGYREQLAYLAYLPLGKAEQAALQLQDAVKTIRFVNKVSPQAISKNAQEGGSPPNWEELKLKAHEAGKASAANNRFGIMDSYYLQYVQPKLAESKGSAVGGKLYPSPEYDDLQLLLEVLGQQGIKPLFIIVPVNGRWYNYTGFPASERTAYYNRIANTVKQRGFSVADFSAHEQDLYFLQDVMHLGWKGWVYVDQALEQFVRQAK